MNIVSPPSSFSPYVNATPGGSVRESSGSPAVRQSAVSGSELSPEELKELTELKARDREVRAHEAAHQSAGGQHAGAISLTYERGADGAQYAVGGEVPIDVSPVAEDPQATIEKMRTVRSAALAPAEPSSQDRAVAAQAMQTLLQAQAELAAEKNDDRSAPEARVSGEGNKQDSEGGGQSLSGQQASDTYRSVSAFNGAPGILHPGALDISV
jgi:hypothetical protein